MTATGEGRSALSRSIEVVGQVLVPAGVLTGLLYYFGYVRQRTLYGYFGIDLGTLGFTSTDYLVRSADAVFRLLVTVLAACALGLLAHHLLTAWLRRAGPHRTPVARAISAVGALGVLAGSSTLVLSRDLVPPALAAAALALGAVLVEYGLVLGGGAERDDTGATTTLRRALLVAMVVVAAFVFATNAAHQNGRRAASAIEKSLPQRTEAVVYSHRALLIGGHGVTVRELAASTSPYGFQYLGLRVLVHANGIWFLVPAGWTGGNEDLVVLLADDDPEIRVDLRP